MNKLYCKLYKYLGNQYFLIHVNSITYHNIGDVLISPQDDKELIIFDIDSKTNNLYVTKKDNFNNSKSSWNWTLIITILLIILIKLI